MAPVRRFVSAIKAMSLLLSATWDGIEPVSRFEATLTITAPVISSTGILRGTSSQKVTQQVHNSTTRTFR